ncbi:MAG TPA: class II aldolase/adducin family protein [Usitatibacter sp.]|nr:class II aldolase/adducin family protein [Usitatibacter sp.]
MSAAERGARERLVAAARRLSHGGLNPGRSGNVSERLGAGFLVTPSALPYDRMGADDMVLVDGSGTARGTRRPSTEWPLHRGIYAARPEAGGIAHTHSPFATTLSCLRRPIPPFHYEVAFAGGRDIRCASYATFGTPELSSEAVTALQGRRACLLANHGVVAFGDTVDAAVELAEKVEALARLYWQALQLGEPALLDEVEMDRVAAKFATYGK